MTNGLNNYINLHLSVRSPLSFFFSLFFLVVVVVVLFLSFLFCFVYLFAFQLGLHCSTWTFSCDALSLLVAAHRLRCLKTYEILVP